MAFGGKWGALPWANIEWAFGGATINQTTITGTGTLTVSPTVTQAVSVTGTGTLTAVPLGLILQSVTITGIGVLQNIITGLRDAVLTNVNVAISWPQVQMPIAYIANKYDRGVVISNQTSGASAAIESSNSTPQTGQ